MGFQPPWLTDVVRCVKPHAASHLRALDLAKEKRSSLVDGARYIIVFQWSLVVTPRVDKNIGEI